MNDIKYVSQWDDTGAEDADACGPTCLAMILNAYGENVTVLDVFNKTGATIGSLINFDQMCKAIAAYGYKYDVLYGQTPDQLKKLLDQKIYSVALVHYGSLSSRQDQGYKGGHFLVPVGYRDDGYFINDPDFWGQYHNDGDHHFYTKPDFETAWSSCGIDSNPNNTIIVVYPKNQPVAVMYNGFDLTNQESMKVCVDDHIAIVNGKYVTADKYNTDTKSLQDTIDQKNQALDNANKILSDLNTKYLSDEKVIGDDSTKIIELSVQLEKVQKQLQDAQGTAPPVNSPQNGTPSTQVPKVYNNWFAKLFASVADAIEGNH